MQFTVTTASRDALGLRQTCQDFAKNLWIPAHYSPEQAAEFVLDQFRRAVLAELEMLEVAVQ